MAETFGRPAVESRQGAFHTLATTRELADIFFADFSYLVTGIWELSRFAEPSCYRPGWLIQIIGGIGHLVI